MEVILLKDVPKVGQRGEVKNVSDGYAQNMLIPRGLAEKGTPAKIAALKKNKEHAQEERAAETAKLIEKVHAANGQRFEIHAKADEKGHLYQKLDAAKVAEAIGVPESVVVLDAPLKEVGEHEVKLNVEKVHGTTTVVVVAE